ncbi:MAG TPA: M23 family metallopeptidase [Bacillota bacterium]|jgi:murein DD-endopeptidase MepM/ murein hydrolase activator NlpD
MSIVALARKPLIKWASTACALALVAGLVTFVYLPARTTYVLEVNGQGLGLIHGKSLVNRALTEIAAAAGKELGRPVRAGRQVMLVRYINTPTEATQPELADVAAIEAALNGASILVTDGFMITVGDEPIVGLLDKGEAQAVINDLKAEEAARIQKRGATVDSLEFEQKVVVAAGPVPLDKLRTKDEAKQILARGTDKVVGYVVSRGDSLWSIAQSHGLSVDTLLKANPQLPGNGAIKPGEQLSLTASEPIISIVSVETKTVKEWIQFATQVEADPDLWPWQTVVKQPGVGGAKEVTYRIERRTADSKETTTVVSEKLLSEPKTQIELRGTKQAPALGTGAFYWPLSAGQITSGFGWRGRGYHTGVDIAAPRGTEVEAADSGTITLLGWDGRYGKAIMIDHDGGRTVTLYGHLNAYADGLKQGSKVEKGQLIGFVGSTGNSTGPHLHFEVRIDGKPSNPMSYFPK